MAVKKYALHGINLLGTTPLLLQQLTQRTLNPKPTVIYNFGAGQFTPSFAGVSTVDPECTFDTTEISRMLTAVPILTGLGIKTGNAYTGVEIYYEAKTDLGGRGGTLSGYKHLTSKAILVNRTITVEQGGEARLSGTLLALSIDGTTAPLTNTDLVTCPLVAASEKYTLGPVIINGTPVNSVMGITIDFGLEVVAHGESGEPYPKFATINRLEPKITIRSSDVTLFSAFPPSGTNISSGASVYLRKFQASSIVYPNIAAQHISFTLPSSQGIAIPGQTSASGMADAMFELELRPLAGAAAMLVVNPLTAIP